MYTPPPHPAEGQRAGSMPASSGTADCWIRVKTLWSCCRAAGTCDRAAARAPPSSEVSVEPEGVVGGAGHDAHPLVLAHALLEEVGLSLQRDVLHEVEGVLHPVDLQRADISLLCSTRETCELSHLDSNGVGGVCSVWRLSRAAGVRQRTTRPLIGRGGSTQPPSSAEVRTPALLIITDPAPPGHRPAAVTLAKPSSSISRSATNSMYCFMRSPFIPISFTGRASVRNSWRTNKHNRSTNSSNTRRCTCTAEDRPARWPRRSWWCRWRFLWTACWAGVWTSDRRSHSADPERSTDTTTHC